MAWLPEEQWAMIEDSIEKKRTAASAFKQRSHCGKGGRVKFPSDFMTKKELKAMSGECVAYRMNEPMTWEEFEKMPNDLKADYITVLRDKFGAPDKYVAEMMCVSQSRFGLYLTDLKLTPKIEKGGWDKEGFLAWTLGVKLNQEAETAPEEVVEKVKEKSPYTWQPMTWEEFKMLSDENKIDYVRWIRNTFKAPDVAIGKMLGCSQHTISNQLRKLNFSSPSTNGKAKWDKDGFSAWASGKVVPKSDYVVEADLTGDEPELKLVPAEEPVVVTEDINEPNLTKTTPTVVEPSPKPLYAVPTYGDLNFDCNAEDALNTLRLLLGNSHVKLHVHWDVVE